MYKSDLSTKWKIHSVFHVLLLEQDTTRKGWMKKLFSKPESKFDASNNKKYKLEAIKNSVVYVKGAEEHLPGLYYLIS